MNNATKLVILSGIVVGIALAMSHEDKKPQAAIDSNTAVATMPALETKQATPDSAKDEKSDVKEADSHAAAVEKTEPVVDSKNTNSAQ